MGNALKQDKGVHTLQKQRTHAPGTTAGASTGRRSHNGRRLNGARPSKLRRRFVLSGGGGRQLSGASPGKARRNAARAPHHEHRHPHEQAPRGATPPHPSSKTLREHRHKRARNAPLSLAHETKTKGLLWQRTTHLKYTCRCELSVCATDRPVLAFGADSRSGLTFTKRNEPPRRGSPPAAAPPVP